MSKRTEGGGTVEGPDGASNGQQLEDTPEEIRPVETNGYRRTNVRSLRAVFRKLEDSKTHVIGRIRDLHFEADKNRHDRERIELELKDRITRTAGSEDKIRALEEEVASLRSDLSAAQEMLEEIDNTLT